MHRARPFSWSEATTGHRSRYAYLITTTCLHHHSFIVFSRKPASKPPVESRDSFPLSAVKMAEKAVVSTAISTFPEKQQAHGVEQADHTAHVCRGVGMQRCSEQTQAVLMGQQEKRDTSCHHAARCSNAPRWTPHAKRPRHHRLGHIESAAGPVIQSPAQPREAPPAADVPSSARPRRIRVPDPTQAAQTQLAHPLRASAAIVRSPCSRKSGGSREPGGSQAAAQAK